MDVETSYSLPSPTDTPYRTPSSSHSYRYRRYEDMSPSSTPPPMPDDRAHKRRSTDSGRSNPALDEKISPLDPRRFTPTLHASLVSEILSLRRDLESRTNDIEKLEVSLHAAQTQNEILNNNLFQSNKETRSIKRQMQLLEGGTLSALTELSKERDDALGDASDLRKRLEQSQKRTKSQEETSERTQSLWDKDRETWLSEKRGMETKVHIAEGRLKVVLSELANVHHHQQHPVPPSPTERAHSRNSLMESPSKGSIMARRGRRHSATSLNSDTHGGRVSVLSFHNGVSINLADELAFDEMEEDMLNAQYNEDGRVSPDALPEEHVRPASSLSIKARKILGLPVDFEEMERNESPELERPGAIFMDGGRHRSTVKYVDTAIQFSPPPSPWPVLDTHTKINGHKPAPISIGSARQINVTPSPVSPVDSIDIGWGKQRPIMVSSACQTVEALPSPPMTPDKRDAGLATIPESALERIETATIGTQTDPALPVFDTFNHKHTGSEETIDLKVPLIAIIPPASRPVTPETHVVLPPRTKSAGTQVTNQVLGIYKSSSMQTEEIRVDIRAIVPLSDMPPAPLSSHYRLPPPNRPVPQLPVTRSRIPPGTSMFVPKRSSAAGPSKVPPMTDNGPLTRDFASNMPRPVRSSSLYSAFDDEAECRDEFIDGEHSPEDDIFSRPTAKFTLKSGKLVSQDSRLEDVSEGIAISAGEAVALENLRLSEDSLPPEMKAILFASSRQSPRRGAQRQNANLKLKRVPSAKNNNMRKAALISSGAAAHQSQHSQSTTTSVDSNNPPPFPVPLRYSSAKVGKSISEGGRSSPGSINASPTKRPRNNKLPKPVLRKARSGPAISPHSQARRSRSRSPPLEPRVSIVPEMPSFAMPTMPSVPLEVYGNPREASAPRPSIATGPNRMRHAKQNSDAVDMHQTSVVDSIAQTMVGEWMFKYVRRRKSFGVTDKADWDPNKSVEEISQNVTNNGVRHKRWVWLAPYERAVMWSSKQPTSGTALMGKSGRKLTIKSVLDVKDDNPMPKGALTGPSFNRSILILTPQRALKFTATSQERHYVWLTALSFLSHSPLSLNDLTAIPPPPPLPEHELLPPTQPSLAGSLRKRTIRDSIRLTKESTKVPGQRSFTTDGSLPVQDLRPPTRDYYDPLQDPALPPTIPRHSRKRSHTAPRAPPSSFKTFSTNGATPSIPAAPSSTYSHSIQSTAVYSSDRGLYTPSLGQSVMSSRRGSESSAPPVPPMMFLDHNQNGTMRMDAFIEHEAAPSSGRPSFNFMRPAQSKKKDMGYWGVEPGRDSISPVDSLLHNEMMAASSSTRGSNESRDPWRGF